MQYVDELERARVEAGEICYQPFNRYRVLYNPVTHDVLDLNCKSYRCPKHQKSWLHRWQVITLREVEFNPVDKLITLTCSSTCTPSQMALAKQLLMRRLREKYQSFEYISVLEFGTVKRYPHLHMLARSKYIYQKVLSAMWAKSCVEAKIRYSPVVYIEAPRSQKNAALYALKYALNGAEKGQAIPETWKGRKITYSKGFFTKCSAKEHWQEYLKEHFGEKEREIWQLKTKQELQALAKDYFSTNLIFDIDEDGQGFFDCVE